MTPLRLGICATSTGLPLRAALNAAQKLAVAGIQLDAVGPLAPDQLSETGRRELRHLLRSHALELSAWQCPLRRGLDVAENQEARIDYLRAALSLSYALGSRLVVVPGPVLPPTDEVSLRATLLREALTALGQHGDRVGARLALEVGWDAAERVRDYLDGFDTGGLAVTFDPGNWLLHGHDPVASLPVLAHRVVYVHARDVRKTALGRGAGEVPLGAGDVDWLGILAGLSAIDYRGWLIVERQEGSHRLADIKQGVEVLRRLGG